jgi:hypothetical protein
MQTAVRSGGAGVRRSGGGGVRGTPTVGRNSEEEAAEVETRRLPLAMESELINRDAPPSLCG